jgi:hypothetical protein
MLSMILSPTMLGQQNERQDKDSLGLVRTYELASIHIEGEIERPTTLELSSLPLHSFPVKELALEDGIERFKGAFSYSGYSLYDVLSCVKVHKANAADFSPATDLYVVVENKKGEKVVVSWCEIFYARDPHRFLLARNVRCINPSKVKASWPAPEEPRLICGNDRLNDRWIGSPTRITVRSFRGQFPLGTKDKIYSGNILLGDTDRGFQPLELDTSAEKRSHELVGFGHGMGFKGINSIHGYVLKDVLKEFRRPLLNVLSRTILIASAKDGYRAVFSASEIFNRSDTMDFLLIDRNESSEDGRYIIFATPDFYVDRNVKSVERIEFYNCQ